MNDGFVFLWSISKNGSARLHSSNKCISNVQDIAWMGSNIITVGTRHVKVWRLEEHLPSSPTKKRYLDGTPSSPTPKALSGRNCILGPLVESIFTCAIATSDCTAIICTENGEICLLDDIDHDQRLEQVATVPFKVFCVSVEIEKNIVLVGGRSGKSQTLDLRKISRRATLSQHGSPALTSDSSSSQDSALCPDILAIGSLRGRVITVNASHHIQLMEYSEDDETAFVGKLTKQIPAHDSAVLGVVTLPQPNSRKADFMSWSSHGIVYFWTMNGICKGKIELALKQASLAGDEGPNVLTVLEALSDDSFLYGDKSGNIVLAREDSISLKAHDGEITDMAVSCRDGSLTLVATCGRDRTLQLFQLEEGHLELLQTLQNEHAATINSVRFLAAGSNLLSASADRTIVIRSKAFSKDQKAVFLTSRVITLKSSPVSIAPSVAQPGILVVSTMDRQFLKYDVRSGHLLRTFKATDVGKNESVILSSLRIGCLRSKNHDADVLLCASSTDRSIRIYDPDTGSLLTKEYGQLVVGDLCLVKQSGENEDTSNVLISAGLDGTVMIWGIPSLEHRNFDGAAVHQAMSSGSSDSAQPLRRVLSRTELLEYQKSLEATQDPPTPTRSHQHGRIKKKASRLTLAATPGQNAPKSSKSAHHSPSSSINEAAEYKLWRDRSSIPPAHKAPQLSRTKRSASDAGQRSPSTVESTSESAPSVEQFCQSLRDYRERLTASSKSLSYVEAQKLERELTLTIQALGTKIYQSHEQSSNGDSEGNALDGWLARMIDERLALKLKQAGGDEKDNKVSGA